MYLPSTCPMRCTDIWRSLVANRIAKVNNWGILFHKPTTIQNRNYHNLMDDFYQEVNSYLYNEEIYNELLKLKLKSGVKNIGRNLILCYSVFIKKGLLKGEEIKLLKSWIRDCKIALNKKRNNY
tara:strand:- start:150 stop:521 length:372 start_codon:yes stop_codon:yes gene_type:complete